MRKLCALACGFVFMAGVLIGCGSADKAQEPATSTVQTNSAGGAAQPSDALLQYRAVCIETDQHGGNEYVLSKWFDAWDKADEIAKYHGDFKYKGHRWRIDERPKPAPAQPQN